MEKDFIDEFIPSKDTRAYLHSIHHEFNDLEKATIVANHIMLSYEEKITWLKEFCDTVSDEQLKERISKALGEIRKNKEYYKNNINGLAALFGHRSLFDFVFIPHDFRHGDIVRCLYGDWNTEAYFEKIGIVLGYFDENYDFYRNLQGDYSDVQICVDIKFDGVGYQGEFEHEHINPIYVERMTLHENDERKTYLDYLTNTYIKKRQKGEKKNNKPEYVADSMAELEQRYLDEYIPVWDEEINTWCVQTVHGFECGDIGYVAGEFSGTSLIYHFFKNGVEDHVHGFDAVLEAVLEDPEHTEIINDHGEYSEQEIRMVEGIKRAAEFVHLHRRPMTNAELRENRTQKT